MWRVLKKLLKGLALLILLVAALAAGIGYWLSASGWKGPVSDHFDGQRFHNLVPYEVAGAGKFVRFVGTERGPWRDWTENRPYPKPPRRVGAGELSVTFVNHATLLVQFDGLNVLSDPIWSDRCSPVQWVGPHRKRPPGVAFQDLPPIDLVLISHNHYDHMDVPTLRRLATAFQPRIVVGLGNRQILEDAGVPNVLEVDWGHEMELPGGLRLHGLPAQHFSSRGLFDRNNTLWMAYAIQGPAGAVYFAGDTAKGPHFEQATQKLGPFRLALLPIGAYLPRWMMEPVHISPEEAVQVHRQLRASTSVAMHFGTFRLGTDGQDQPVQALQAALAAAGEPAPRFWVLDFGETRAVP